MPERSLYQAPVNGLSAISKSGLCVYCKGSTRLCGKDRCPIVVRLYSRLKLESLMKSTELDGTSPPGVFVGRFGYPHVYAGPLVPPIQGDTSLFDIPEYWFGRTIDEIVNFRSMLVRGKFRVDVRQPYDCGRLMDMTRELALASNPLDLEVQLKNRPTASIVLDDDVQPYGPSALLKDMCMGNTKIDRSIEYAHYDSDLKASEAVLSLYDKGVLVSKIQKGFSVGAFGLGKKRKIVPTRWSITAVDSILSGHLMEKVRTYPIVNEYRVYESGYIDNRFEILMMPERWSYESIEAWYPGSAWNPQGKEIVCYGDWEGFDGRTTYAAIGGCYYAARLAVTENLNRERRQACVAVLREAHPGYIMPVGVWQVRENVRNAMRSEPLKFKTLREALERVASKLDISLSTWIDSSKLLREALFQTKLTNFIHSIESRGSSKAE